MTLVACVVTPNRAWIAADSVCYHRHGGGVVLGPDGREVEDQKLIQFPRFVMTGLGTQALRDYAAAAARELPDIDAAIEILPSILRADFKSLRLRAADAVAGAGGNTILAVGFSNTRGHMVLATFKAADNFSPELHGSANDGSYTWWRNPNVPRESYDWPPNDREKLIEFAHATVSHHRENDPAIPIGGRLMLAEITRDSIMMSCAGDLGMPARADAEHAMSDSLAGVMCGQIAANAATDTNFASGYTDTIGILGSEPSHSTLLDVTNTACSISYTNPTSWAIVVHVDAGIVGPFAYDFANVTTHTADLTVSGAVSGNGTFNIFSYGLPDTSWGAVSRFFEFPLASGATLNLAITLHSIVPSTSSTRGIAATGNLRAAAIKR